MIVVKLLGGLGNQLFQWAYGAALARRGYEVVFDRSALVEGTHREYSLGEYFNLKFHEPTRCVVYEKSLSFNPAALNPEEGSTLVGYWQSEKYFEDIAPFLRHEFNHHWMCQPLVGIAKTINEEIYTSNSVFLHVRRQDYVGLQHYHGMPSLDYYQEAAERIRSQVYDPKFFVFSDDTNWCKENFPSDFRVIEGTSKYDDLRLMASCRNAIIANSSFSWWGAWLGDNQLGRIVISPKRWFSADVENDIITERWVRL